MKNKTHIPVRGSVRQTPISFNHDKKYKCFSLNTHNDCSIVLKNICPTIYNLKQLFNF